MSKSIIIDNVTEKDALKRILRITVDNKPLFPEEKIGNPFNYQLFFKHGEKHYEVNYRIGSKDGKSRSGVLRLGDELYNDVLKISKGEILKITKGSDNNYNIEKT